MHPLVFVTSFLQELQIIFKIFLWNALSILFESVSDLTSSLIHGVQMFDVYSFFPIL